MSNFSQAAVSYLALPDGCELIAMEKGAFYITVPITTDLMAGIAARMKAMDEEAARVPEVDPATSMDVLMRRQHQWMIEYSVMTAAERSKYGSRAAYLKARERGTAC